MSSDMENRMENNFLASEHEREQLFNRIAELEQRVKVLTDALKEARASFLGLQPDFGGPVAAQMSKSIERINTTIYASPETDLDEAQRRQ